MTQIAQPEWVWQQPDWPLFQWQADALTGRLEHIAELQAQLLNGAAAAGFPEEAELNALLDNIIQSSAIEGETLDTGSVRSSLVKRLGVAEAALPASNDRSEGLVALQWDATRNYGQSLTFERLLEWHALLFPQSEFRLAEVGVGMLRGPEAMQVVSGPVGKRVVHFEAPPREGLENRLQNFLAWLENSASDDLLQPVLRAALAHLWFVTLHPFDDGNGRLARAITDYALAQAESQSVRLYAMSASIMVRRKEYYLILEQTQRAGMEVTPWLSWFLDTLIETLESALGSVSLVLQKARFWQRHAQDGLNEHQVKVLNKLLDAGPDGFEGDLSAKKYMGITGVAKATATRHLTELLAKGALSKLDGGGRQTRYAIEWPPVQDAMQHKVASIDEISNSVKKREDHVAPAIDYLKDK
ncbi:MAG: Fic family protein [Halioglobus sp.]